MKLWHMLLREVTEHPYFQSVLATDAVWRESDPASMISEGRIRAFARVLTTTKFKEGMDVYMKRRMTDDVESSLVHTAQGERKRMIDRVRQDSRKSVLFQERGRLDKRGGGESVEASPRAARKVYAGRRNRRIGRLHRLLPRRDREARHGTIQTRHE